MGMPWPDDDLDDLPPRQRQMREARLAREREQRLRLLNLPQTLAHALEVSPVHMAHLRWGNRYFVVSARVLAPPTGYTLAYTYLPGDGVEDVKSIKRFAKKKAEAKLQTAGVSPTRPIWLPIHEGNQRDPYALPDTVLKAIEENEGEPSYAY